MKIIARILCFLFGNHFVRRTPEIVKIPQVQWRTKLSCWCGRVCCYLPGLVRRDGSTL